MLVCIIATLERRATVATGIAEVAAAADAPAIANMGLAADLAEATLALDAPGIGNIVFATLVDDPASVRETVDAFLGQIMRETASAAATVNAGFTYAAAIAEAGTAADLLSSSISGVAYATWDPSTVANVTLSGGNLIATNTGTTSADQGAKVASASAKTSGKFYFEVTANSVGPAGINNGVGVGTTASTYTNMGNGGTTGDVGYKTGSIYSNGSSVGTFSGYGNGLVMAVAVDLDNRRIWFRQLPSGLWNNSGTANPATNTGGITIPAGTMVPFVLFGGGGGSAGTIMTANFGASAFAGAVPSGFTAGWPQ